MKNFLLIFMLAISGFSLAQYTINGSVKNNEDKPVGFASVTLYDALSNKVITFKNTNSKGEYTLSFKEFGKYIIKVRNIKYKEYKEDIVISENQKTTLKDIQLSNTENQLKEVVAKGSSDARIKGDTISFKIGRFTDKTEKTLGDIINKLPGMEVDESGNIKANGKKVDKLMVEGQDFFSDSHKMATQNLNSKAVKDIQLLTDYKEKGKLDEMNGGEKKTALNINLNDDYKNKITGDIRVSSGYKEKYDVHTNLFKFNKTGNISFIGAALNTGEQVLSFEDYMAFAGGFDDIGATGRGNNFRFSFGGDGLGALLNSSNNVEKRTNEVAALNINQSLGAKSRIKFMNVLSHTKQKDNTSTLRNYFQKDANGNFINELNSDLGKDDIVFNTSTLKYQYQPNDSTLVKYNTSFNISKTISKTNIVNTLNGANQNFDNNSKLNPFDFNQNLSYEFKLNKRSIVNLSAFHSFKKENTDAYILSNTPYLNLFVIGDVSPYNTLHNKENTLHELGANANIKYSKWKKIFKWELSYKNTNSSFDTDLYKIINANQTVFHTDEYQNRTHFIRNDFSSEFTISKNKNFFQYELGALFKYYDLNIKNQNEKFNRFVVYPFVNFSFNFSTSSVLEVGYDYTDNFPNLENYTDKKVINGYRSINILQDITPNLYFPNHDFSLNYRYFNQFSGFNMFTRFSYAYQDESLSSFSKLNIAGYSEIETVIAPNSKSYSGFFNIGKKFSSIPFQIRLSGNVTYSEGFTAINSTTFTANSSRTIRLSPSINTLFKPAFNMEVGLRYNLNKNEIDIEGRSQNELKSYSPFIEFRGAYPDTGWDWKTRLRLNSYDGSSTENLWTWDFNINYLPKGSDWEFGFSGNNILNLNNATQVNNAIGVNYFQETQYKILPGYYMFSVKLRFK